MVVTGSRLHAVRYKQAFDKYLTEKGYTDIGVLVAFSGTVEDPDVADRRVHRAGMNDGIREKELPGKFATDEYQVLLVANKYQTGFDQPLLHTMYVDKRLSGVQAVQTLSRLNRTCPGKNDTFVLDFVNDAEEIQRSFQPYYEQTTVAETADPQQLYELQHELDAAQVYSPSEVEAFCKVFYTPKAEADDRDHAEMYRHLAPAVDRFTALDEETQEEFRVALRRFVRLYAFLSQSHAVHRRGPGEALHLRPVPGAEAPAGPEEDAAQARCRHGARLLPARQDPPGQHPAGGRRAWRGLPARRRRHEVGASRTEVKLSEVIDGAERAVRDELHQGRPALLRLSWSSRRRRTRRCSSGRRRTRSTTSRSR